MNTTHGWPTHRFTKGGVVWDEQTRAAEPLRVGRPESLRHEVEASLRQLGTERIDLYQMHWPADDGSPLADYWLGHVDTLQPPLSAIHRQVALAAALQPIAQRHDTSVAAVAVAWTLAWPGVTGAGRGPADPEVSTTRSTVAAG